MKHINNNGKQFQLFKTENEISLVCDDDAYRIIPSGFADPEKQYLLIDVGPHFNGETTHMSKEQIFIIFGVDVSQPEFDNFKK